jgi:hypothetical protein
MRCQPGGLDSTPVRGADIARCGDVYENKVTGERGVVLRGNEDSDGQPALVCPVVQPHGAAIGEHTRTTHIGLKGRGVQ